MSNGYRCDAEPDLWPRLVDVLASTRHAVILLSGYPNEHNDALGWRHIVLRATRTVQARAGGRLPAVPETIWLSPTWNPPEGNELAWPPAPTANPTPTARLCLTCGSEMESSSTGRPRDYCTRACQARAYRCRAGVRSGPIRN